MNAGEQRVTIQAPMSSTASPTTWCRASRWPRNAKARTAAISGVRVAATETTANVAIASASTNKMFAAISKAPESAASPLAGRAVGIVTRRTTASISTTARTQARVQITAHSEDSSDPWLMMTPKLAKQTPAPRGSPLFERSSADRACPCSRTRSLQRPAHRPRRQ